MLTASNLRASLCGALIFEFSSIDELHELKTPQACINRGAFFIVYVWEQTVRLSLSLHNFPDKSPCFHLMIGVEFL
ncbi:hypothetical protein SAMN04515695_5921 [Pseudovibrio sp. Tun.PSC04-5.I4]|nr:hypothetical protein SAMN04515695_5921 [Pseudovibrio sp. Tun.PSC04-5.I4]